MANELMSEIRVLLFKSPIILVSDRKGNSHDRSFRRIVKIVN